MGVNVLGIFDDLLHNVLCLWTSDPTHQTDRDCRADRKIQVATLFLERYTKNVPLEIWALYVGGAALQLYFIVYKRGLAPADIDIGYRLSV